MNREDEHIDIRHKLLKLPKVKAREGFENELLKRINLIEAEKKPAKRSEGIFSLLFGKKSLVWTVPAMSLTVVAVILVGYYYIVNNGGFDKKQESAVITQQKGDSSVPPPPTLTKDEDIAGREITNDMEIGRDSRITKKTEVKTGVNETYREGEPKTETKGIDEFRSGVSPDAKSDDVKQKLYQPSEKMESDKNIIEEKKLESPKKSEIKEKKIVSPMLKETEKVSKEESEEYNTGKVSKKDSAKDSTKESKKKKANKEKQLTEDILESLSKKIKDNK